MIEIHLIFTTSNQLKMTIANSVNQHLGLKICFSLVYSIESVDGGTITKKVGRYYEILIEKSEIFLTLQKTKIGSYNLSCGPEGLFVIDDNDKKIVEKARTLYKVIDKNSICSLVEMKPITGRKHQLRKQLFNIGHSIYGDLKYKFDPYNLALSL